MDKKTILTILAILIIPILAFFGLTFKQDTSNVDKQAVNLQS